MTRASPPSTPQSCHSRGEAGFSLVEAIVALALLAMITGLLASSMRGMRFVHAAMERSDRASSVLAAQSYLRSLLGAVAPSGASTLGNTEPVFAGDPAGMSLRSTHAPLGQLQGLYRVTLSLEPSAARPSAYDLVVQQTIARIAGSDGQQADAPSRRSRLVTGIEAASFAYFGAQGDGDEAQSWRTAWSSADRLPRMVRIAVRFPPGDPRSWPAMDIPLQLAGQDATRCSGRQPC